MKKCSICDIEKDYTSFNKDKNKKDGIESRCRECMKKRWLDYYSKNKEELSIKSKNSEVNKQYRENNKEKRKEYNKMYRENNKEKRKIYSKEYNIKNREKRNKKQLQRKNSDPLFKLKLSIRNLTLNSFKMLGLRKNTKTELILGCSFEYFKIHLEKQFEPWMNWDNKGNPKDGLIEPNKTWDIDHIIPLSSATTEEDMIKLGHYTNLRPLCSYVNRFIKKDRNIKTNL